MSVFDLQISEETERHIMSLIKWSKIFSIIGFLLMLIFTLISVLGYWSDMDSDNPNDGLALCTFLISISLVMFLPSLLSHRLSRHLKAAILNSNQFHFDQAFRCATNFFKVTVLSFFIFFISCYFIITFI
jgi:hypothetical protein